MMLRARERGLPFICANPDIVVERGDRFIYCAGAIAELYRELGGEVIFYGKPHRPIYERAVALADQCRDTSTPLSRILAIGDSVRTDLAGAQAFGIDCLFGASIRRSSTASTSSIRRRCANCSATLRWL